MIRSSATRGVAAFAALLLVAGTVLAADPSADPSASPESTTSTTPSTSPSATPVASAAAATASASEEPSASASPVAPTPSAAPRAAEEPDSDEGPPSAENIARIVGRLKEAGITVTAAQLQGLADKVGVGGAVRVVAFAHASGKTPAQILALYQSGKGWGQIDHELGLSIGPGIGWIMGHGRGHGQGPKP